MVPHDSPDADEKLQELLERERLFQLTLVWLLGLLEGEGRSAALCRRGPYPSARHWASLWRRDCWCEEKAPRSSQARPVRKPSLRHSPWFIMWSLFFLLWNWKKINNIVPSSVKTFPWRHWSLLVSLLLAERIFTFLKELHRFLNSLVIQCGCDLGFLFWSQVR